MDADRSTGYTIEFDSAVAAARRFADGSGERADHRDHECAGFSLIGALAGGISNL